MRFSVFLGTGHDSRLIFCYKELTIPQLIFTVNKSTFVRGLNEMKF